MSKQEDKNIDIDPQNKQANDPPEVKEELSKVSINSKQSMVIAISIAAIIAFLLFNFFFKDVSTKGEIIKPTPIPTDIIKHTEAVPVLPMPPRIATPTLPDIPLPNVSRDTNPKPLPRPSLPSAQPKDTIVSLPSSVNTNVGNKTTQQKYKSAIMAISGSTQNNAQAHTALDNPPGNLLSRQNYTIVAGKIIDAVLETAINSDTGAPQIRAIISRDIYSDSGKNILIPKGSRIYGASSVASEDGRVNISWNQIYMFNGYVLDLNATLVDNLGRAGEQGVYDPKNKEKMVNAVMMTAFNIVTAKGLDVLIPPTDNSQTQNTYQIFVTQVNTIVNTIPTDQNDVNATKICTDVGAVLLKYPNLSTYYTSFTTACTASYSDDKKYAAIKSALDSSNLSILSISNDAKTTTQQASTQGYKTLTNTVKNMLNNKQVKPTTSMSHGKNIKIYVNQTYVFPKDHLHKIKILR